MRKIFYILLVFPMMLFSCQKEKNGTESPDVPAEKMTIKVSSSALEQGELIPSKYTADGQNISPPLEWQDMPTETKSIALICDDPDAPLGTWVHWVMWNIPPEKSSLAENVPAVETLPDGTKQGITDFKSTGYGGPAPPSGTHRYYFKIYALDIKLSLPADSTKANLLKAMKGHILAEGRLMGTYKRH
jgi:Raf kinase inhibitor-like YbhB/YbcL family protein